MKEEEIRKAERDRLAEIKRQAEVAKLIEDERKKAEVSEAAR